MSSNGSIFAFLFFFSETANIFKRGLSYFFYASKKDLSSGRASQPLQLWPRSTRATNSLAVLGTSQVRAGTSRSDIERCIFSLYVPVGKILSQNVDESWPVPRSD
jgi:hypothetical protein